MARIAFKHLFHPLLNSKSSFPVASGFSSTNLCNGQNIGRSKKHSFLSSFPTPGMQQLNLSFLFLTKGHTLQPVGISKLSTTISFIPFPGYFCLALMSFSASIRSEHCEWLSHSTASVSKSFLASPDTRFQSQPIVFISM